MAGERTLPGLGVTGFWNEGSAYKTQMDENLLRLSTLAQLSAKSRTLVLPGTPSLGDIYIVKSDDPTNPNKIAVWDGEAAAEEWVYFDARLGLLAWIEDTSTLVVFNGTAWTEVSAGGGSGGIDRKTPLTADHTLLESDLAGNVYREIGAAGDLTVTVPPDLVGTEPVTFERTNTGAVTFAPGAGVTINASGGALSIATTFGSATLVPKGSNVYTLIGNLSE